MCNHQLESNEVLMEDEECLDFQMQIWKTMEDDPLFHHSFLTPSADDLQRLTTLRCKKIRSHKFLIVGDMLQNPIKLLVLTQSLCQYDMSLGLKYFVPFIFFINSVRDLGTEKHEHFIRSAEKEEINGCYALTEVAHGTNVKKMRTTATFDPKTQEFIIHSEDFESGKCWIGGLGKSATHATVFAQLITPDGVKHGLHAFVIPLRNPKTMLLYPGVLIGDMGEKIGLNGVDNGFAVFTKYRLPKDNLLDKMGTVTQDGKYISAFDNPRERFATSLSTLSLGRTGVSVMSTGILLKAVVIAIRYSAVRRQFGSSDGEELAIIEYQLQQWRLFPYLAASYAFKIFCDASISHLFEFRKGIYFEEDKEKMAVLGMEIHIIQSSAKGLTSWTTQHGIQECREACGGHGYLKCAGFGALRNDNDANCTYEGDNNVLCQQTSNWLLHLWAARNMSENKIITPLGSADFLYTHDIASRNELGEEVPCFVAPILEAYDILLIWLLENTSKVYEEHCKVKDSFTARSDSQVYFARTLSMVFIERFVIKTFWEFCNSEKSTGNEKAVLQKLCSLYGLWSLEKHLGTLYECGYATGPQPTRLIREGILQICLQLKPEAVALADAIAPPDFILNSVIGKSDGKLYQNIEGCLIQTPGATQRPVWWRDIIG
ncbi:hypothetical protein L9F63_013815, partial [Diploptera punctata]